MDTPFTAIPISSFFNRFMTPLTSVRFTIFAIEPHKRLFICIISL